MHVAVHYNNQEKKRKIIKGLVVTGSDFMKNSSMSDLRNRNILLLVAYSFLTTSPFASCKSVRTST